MQYNNRIDDETQSFLDLVLSSAPTNPSDLSFAEQRRIFDQFCSAFRPPRPDVVSTADEQADGVPVRVYSAGHPTRTVLYMHGGGFALGGLDSHDDICAEICAQTGYRVVSVGYRLAPEHKHPAAFDDCLTALHWARARFADALVLAGDSAGANLAAALCHHLRGQDMQILGQVLIYPWLGDDLTTPSCLEHSMAPLLNPLMLAAFRATRLPGLSPQGDPRFAPLLDRDFRALPPTALFSADLDPLRDDARLYHDALQNAGVPVHWVNEPGLFHGYMHARSNITRARDSFERIILAIEALGQEIWPWS